jgi:hypothetical protein
MDNDPNLLLIMMPLLDFVNHSNKPNAGIVPFVDKVDDNHSYLILKALEDIEPDTQLHVNYGNLSNMHMVQKYGFTQFNED